MYMSNATAKFWEQEFGAITALPLKNTFSRVALSVCKPATTQHEYPLILFSPGLGLARQFYNILGFTVATVDVPGELGFITFLDGSTERGDANITTPANTPRQSTSESRILNSFFIAFTHIQVNLITSIADLTPHQLLHLVTRSVVTQSCYR